MSKPTYTGPMAENRVPRTLNICPVCDNTILLGFKEPGEPMEWDDKLFCERCGWKGRLFMTYQVDIH
ncbi:MAG: hypothetical protein DRP02_14530 [Candidatus Gerdarchaeota archaeon]|nr:MAG: hypothetical protein DRP02_14530 [Candidatus Gerdarchaeota archaeon]